MEAEQGLQEARHPTQGGEGQARTQYVQLDEGCTPITTCPSNLPKEHPWESGLQQTTLESCRAHYDKLQNDISSLDLALENKQSIEMVCNHCKNSMRYMKILDQKQTILLP